MIRPRLAAAPFVLAALLGACGSFTETSLSPAGPSTVDPGSSSNPPSSSSCAVGVNGIPDSVESAGGRYSFAIATGNTCSWAARTDVTWADVTPGSGLGSGTAVLAIQANTGFDTRTVHVTLSGHVFQVVQNGRACSYAVSPTALDLGAHETAATITVTAPAECSWGATASESWIRVVSVTGRGNGTVALQIADNGGDTRHASLTIAGQHVPVTQQRP
jgi:hypothetical protein